MNSSILKLPELPSIKNVVKLYKLKAKKQLSQNFILNYNLCKKIVNTVGDLKHYYVCEVGPGPGGLTRAILEAGAKHLVVIEKDYRFFPSLQILNKASDSRMSIHHGDVLLFNTQDIFPSDISSSWEKVSPKAHIIGNLPFSISTPLIIRWLKEISRKEGAWTNGRVPLTLTFQSEVAERIVASSMKHNRCRLSVMCQNWCHVENRFKINKKAFVPSPDVDVVLVQFVPRITPLIGASFPYVEKLLRNIFHYRRKMIWKGLQTLFPPERSDLLERLISQSQVHSDSRSYSLEMDDFDRLCRSYQDICQEEGTLLQYDYRSKENAIKWKNKKTMF